MKYILVTFLTAVVAFTGFNAFKPPMPPVQPRVWLELVPTATGFDARVPEGIEMGEVAKLFVEALKKEGRIACKK